MTSEVSDAVSGKARLRKLRVDVKSHAGRSDWQAAIRECELCLCDSDPVERGSILELLGDSLYSAAFQQSSREKFQGLILSAKDAFDKVSKSLDGSDTLTHRCSARAAFCNYLASDDVVARRKVIVDDCIAPLRKFRSTPSRSRLAPGEEEDSATRIDAELLRYLLVACHTILDADELTMLVKETRTFGQMLLSRANPEEDRESYVQAANSYVLFLEWAAGIFLGPLDLSEASPRLVAISEKLVALSNQSSDNALRSLALETAASISIGFQSNLEFGTMLLEKALGFAKATDDAVLIGRQLTSLSNAHLWSQQEEADAEKRRQLLLQSSDEAANAVALLGVPFVSFYLSFAYSLNCCALTELAKNEALPQVKLELLNRAVEAGRAGMKISEASSIDFVRNRLADALRAKAEMSEEEGRDSLLSEALQMINEHLERSRSLSRADSWNLGLAQRDAGELYAELSDCKQKKDEKSALLESSVSSLRHAADILLSGSSGRGQESSLALIFEDLGNSLLKQYELTGERDCCLRAIGAFNQSVKYYEKENMEGSVAHFTIYLNGKAATLYDRLGEFEESAKHFARGVELCELAASQKQNLQESFLGLASFSRANQRIEEARLAHRDEKFADAALKLKEASEEFARTEGYRYLAKHYLACSMVEEGEDCGRKEKNLEAAQAFENAGRLFSESHDDILNSRSTMPSEVSEKVKIWAEFSAGREKYCAGRKVLALAKSLDKEAQPEESMYKYRSAASLFRELKSGTSFEEKDELEAIATSCDAWATMKEAEYRSSPELYARASSLFSKAKDRKMRRSFVLSCLANASICRALEAGTKFKSEGKVELYSEIKKQLAAAAQFYDEAGLDNAADWTSATESLFDALAYLSSAESEMDPGKKTQLYHLAEKHLELSAKRYGESGFEKKRQEVLKQLKKVKENKELLLSPIEALSQNPTSYSTPANFTSDNIGLERFDGSGITGNFATSTKTAIVGSSLRIDIDIANVGRSTMLLMKLDNIAPEHGFEPEVEKETHHFVSNRNSISIDLKGRRLEHLKTHEMSLHLRVRSKGTFDLKPRILYVDEGGKYRTYEFESQRIEAKELGFMGWAKGN